MMLMIIESHQYSRKIKHIPGRPCNLCNHVIFNKLFSCKMKPQILTISSKKVWKTYKSLRLRRLHRFWSVSVMFLRDFKIGSWFRQNPRFESIFEVCTSRDRTMSL
jgi:hypothetical protein